LLALQAAKTSRTFLSSAIRLLRAVVPADAAYVMLHCYDRIGRSSEAWGTDGRVFDEEWMRGHHAANPTLPILASHPGKTILTLRDCYRSEAAAVRSRFYRRYLAPRGSRYAAALFFWNEERDSVDCAITLHRGPARPDFTTEELSALEMLHPHIATAFRRIARQQSEDCARESLQNFLSELPLPTILLDSNLRVVYSNSAGREAVALWTGRHRHLKRPAAVAISVPRDLLAAMEQMRAAWKQSLRASPSSAVFQSRTISHGENLGVYAAISMTPLRSAHFARPSFLLRFEQVQPKNKGKILALARLTPRERELALLVCEAKSNQEIADAFGRNLNTVKGELHSIFTKLGLKSRGQLMALMR
jgi:DNA-binding CsgD family transcriptional regulator